MKIVKNNSVFDSVKTNRVFCKLFKNQKVVKVSEICDIVRGGSPRPIKNYITNDNNETPWLKIKDATSVCKYIETTKEYIIKNGESYSRVVNPGDFIVSNSATPGIPRIMKIRACIHDGWLLLNDIKINKDYLFYLFNSIRDQLVSQGQGSIFKNLSKDILANFEIKIYENVKQQEKIASVLSMQEDQIERIKSLIEKIEKRNGYYAEKLLSGELRMRENKETGKLELYENEDWQDVVLNGKSEKAPTEWKKTNLSKISSIINGFSFKSKDMSYNGKYPIIKMSNFKDGIVEINKLSKFTNSYIEKSKIKKNDLLMGLSGSVGSIAIFNLNMTAFLNQRCLILRSNDYQDYINYCLKYLIPKYVKNNSFGGVINNLSHRDVEKFELMWSNEIIEISNIVKSMNNELDKLKQLLPKEEKRFQWMLDNLLSGEYEIVD